MDGRPPRRRPAALSSFSRADGRRRPRSCHRPRPRRGGVLGGRKASGAIRGQGDPRGRARVRRPRGHPRRAGSGGCGQGRPLPLGDSPRARAGAPERGARRDGRRAGRSARHRQSRSTGSACRTDGGRTPLRDRDRRVGRRRLPRPRALPRLLGRRRGDEGARLRPPDDARLRPPGLRGLLPLERGREPRRDDDHGRAHGHGRRARGTPPPARPARTRGWRRPRAARTPPPRHTPSSRRLAHGSGSRRRSRCAASTTTR